MKSYPRQDDGMEIWKIKGWRGIFTNMLMKEKDSIAPSSPIKTRNNYHCTERANMKLLLRQRRAQRQGVSYPPATLLGSTRPSQSSREMDGAKTNPGSMVECPQLQ